jgi:signal transduction histidine kinase/HAMP domain-containing protein
MSRLHTLRLRDRAALLVMAVALAIGGLVSQVAVLSGLERQSLAAVDQAWVAEISLAASSVALANERVAMQDYVLTGDPQLMNAYLVSREQAVRTSGELAVGSARVGVGVGPLQQAVGDWQGWADATVALPAGRVTPGGLEQGASLFAAVIAREEQLEERLHTVVARAIAEAGRRSFLLVIGPPAVGELLLGLLLLLWGQTVVAVLRPIDRLAESARSISRGEASEIPGLDRRDELGQLARALAAWRQETAHRLDLANAVAAETEQQAQTLDLLNQAASATSGVLDPGALDQVLCQKARALLGGAETLLARRSPEGDVLSVVARDSDGSPLCDLALEEGGLVSQAFRSGEPLLVEDGTRSVAAVPLVAGDRTTGVLAACATGERHLGERDVRVLALLARQAAPALEAARLHTELVRAHRELTRTNEELACASRHKSDFVASMSHELRTPLNAILGFSELLLDSGGRGVGPARQTAFIRHIHRSGMQLLGLINDVLDLAKVEAGQMELRIETVDLAETVSAALSTMEPLAGQDGVELVADCSGPLPVEADGDKVQQMLLNLLSNAIKFTPRGGRVTVEARRQPDRVVICVADTGIGIAPEDHDRIFEEFQQLHSSRERRRPGTGLGLTLTRRLVELHGGRIRVESEPGRGSRFFVELPAPAGGPPAGP